MAASKLYKVTRAILRTTWVTLNNVYAIPTYLFWMLLLLPLRYVTPHLYWTIEGYLYRWLLLQISGWVWSAGYTVADVGDDITSCLGEEAVVIMNHQTEGDAPVMMNALQNKGTEASNILWIMDDVLKYTQFGWAGLAHGEFFIQQGREYRDSVLPKLRDHLNSVYRKRDRKWIMLYPEGGFVRKRRLGSQRYAKQHGFPVLEHVALPRIKCMKMILDTLSAKSAAKGASSKRLKWVIDVTIGYPDRTPLELIHMLWGLRPPCQTTLYWRKYPIEDIPTDSIELQTWLFARFQEKDQLLDEFYCTGKFPLLKNAGHMIKEPVVIGFSTAWIVTVNIMFLCSTVFHCFLIHRLYSIF